MLTPCQCRMARAAVGLSRPEFASQANVSIATLSDFELGKRVPYDRTLRDIRGAFEGLGVTFLVSDASGDGVRYRDAN
jgi:transcriptional regulator with XRE-family HTH domain